MRIINYHGGGFWEFVYFQKSSNGNFIHSLFVININNEPHTLIHIFTYLHIFKNLKRQIASIPFL